MRRLLRVRTLAVGLVIGAVALLATNDTTGLIPINETSRIDIDLPTIFDNDPDTGETRHR